MSDEIATLEQEIRDTRLQLESVQSGLQADPENQELQSLKIDLEELITLTETAIAELKPTPAAAVPPKPSSPPVKEKWSKENHPAYQAGYRKPEPTVSVPDEAQQPSAFSVNDNVSARWKSGDGGYYPARITSITGSKANPVYIVKFRNYGSTETLTAKDIKALSTTNNNNANNASLKRKADGNVPGFASPSLPNPNPSVISAAASVDPALASQVKREPSKVSDGPTRPPKVPRKVKANKELEAGKSKWQDFTMKGKISKTAKKESMFRTPEGVNARVGFTGSGQTMRKDPTRSRHIYQQDQAGD